MVNPKFEEYRKMAGEYRIVPVWQEITTDTETPISIYKKISRNAPGYLLESVEGGENLARYSFLGIEPFAEFTLENETVTLRREGETVILPGDAGKVLSGLMGYYRAPKIESLPRFYGGMVGYFGYDFIRTLEELPIDTVKDVDTPDIHLFAAGVVLIYDHLKHSLKIVVNSMPGEDYEDSYLKAQAKIGEIIELIEKPMLKEAFGDAVIPGGRANMTREEFHRKVEQIKEYIMAGDVFQVVLSQRMDFAMKGDPFEFYRKLRRINPAPYLYYLNFGPTVVVGASPEMLVRVEEGVAETRPIAGTRPRGQSEKEDLELAQDLLADPKEKAEHLMLVDLGRNDLGRVCEPGTVEVTSFMEVEKYSHVMHMVTAVKGQLAEGLGAMDALKSCFPAGTVSGAPKIRAMEIIEELEPTRRGVYGGAVGYWSFTGNLDTCLCIRTLVAHGERAYLQVGAGIVADSDPEKEYQETMNKGRALLEALSVREVV